MIRELLEKIDRKFDWKAEKNEAKAFRKAIIGGACEGILDGLVINGAIYLSVVYIVNPIIKAVIKRA